ncbi:DUF4232 domain-containing protein [Streptomyces sp. NPDC023588]|uniref:DUF4232 domain-containing protein n=1 Tax=Streptomyces sp. NPDC023588 TaxID=3154907 RepID=UPI0033FEB0B4
MRGPRRRGAGRGPGPWAVAVAAVACACALSPSAGPAAAAPAGARSSSTAPCTNEQLTADGARRVDGSRVRVTVSNDGPAPCVLKGFPTVALAGQGSPDRNKPLHVVEQGPARAVELGVGGRASTELAFTPVLGEAGGYCASGAEPTVVPSLVVGVSGAGGGGAGGGGFQLAPDDGGQFALCGATVHATAFRGSGS